MSYLRVIPRDFFNESKLLKCLGAFHLLRYHTMTKNMLPFQCEHDGSSFEVVQDPNDGSLSVVNYIVTLRGESVKLYIPYNNKTDSYPLYADYLGKAWRVLNSEGKFLWEEC